MATIIKNYKIVGKPEHDESIDFAKKYWGSLKKEKMFPIPFWEVRKMLGASSSNQIALRVKNIKDPEYVSAQWMILEDALADTLRDPVEEGIIYYVLDDTTFDGPLITNRGSKDGMIKASRHPQRNIIWGRLGKSNTGDYHAFFLVAECKILTGGAGGIGPACGAKIPPGGNQEGL